MRDSKYQGIHGAEKTKNPGKDQLIWGTEPVLLCPHSPSPLPFPPQVFVPDLANHRSLVPGS